MKFTWEVVQHEGHDVVVRYRRVWLTGEALIPVKKGSDSVECSLTVEPHNLTETSIPASLTVDAPFVGSVSIFGSLEVEALAPLNIEGSLEIVNYDGRAELGCVLEVQGTVTVVERMGKDYMVKGRINPAASDDVIKATIDVMVKNDYMKHRLVGLRGGMTNA